MLCLQLFEEKMKEKEKKKKTENELLVVE